MAKRIESAILLPFNIDSYGNIASTTDQQKIWQDRAISVIGTLKTERVMNMDFGTTIPKALFENMASVQDIIKRDVANAFKTYLPLLTLDSVTTTVDQQLGTIYAEILYSLPNKDQTSITVGIASISGSGLLSEELA